ncbi:MAG TPA: M23 family metallopeptidase [Bacillota bacterium]|nr:M23 family metallopeptidase [Bacillota bacterium]
MPGRGKGRTTVREWLRLCRDQAATMRRRPAMAARAIRRHGPQLCVVLLAIATLFAVDLARENRVLRTRLRWHIEREIAAAEPVAEPDGATEGVDPHAPQGTPGCESGRLPDEGRGGFGTRPYQDSGREQDRSPTLAAEAEPAVAAVAARPEDAEWPAIGQRLRGFGWHWSPTYGDYRLHTGIDLRVPVGAEVRAALPGQVVSAGRERLWAYRVVIDHGGGLQTVYAHLNDVHVAAGDWVIAGRILGRIGSPGEAELADGVLLHFEMRRDGHPVDPENYLR